jgi:hypothetical protein
MDAALFESEISRFDRITLLQLALHLFVSIHRWFQTIDGEDAENSLPCNRSKKASNICLFSEVFLVEVIPKSYSHIVILRRGTMPLEKTFHALRQRSRDSDTDNRALQ